MTQALQRTETVLTDYARQLQHDRELERVRDSDADAVSQAQQLYRFGRTGFLELRAAEDSLAHAEDNLALEQASITDRQIDVFLALGGNWG